jgi:hypothetical protein
MVEPLNLKVNFYRNDGLVVLKYLGVELQGVGPRQECFGIDQSMHPSIVFLFTTTQLQINIKAKPIIQGSNNQLF